MNVFTGLDKLIPDLRNKASEQLGFQLDVFEDETADDWQELMHRFNVISIDDQIAWLIQLYTQIPRGPS